MERSPTAGKGGKSDELFATFGQVVKETNQNQSKAGGGQSPQRT